MNFIAYQIEVSACLAFFYIVYILFLKRETFFKANRYVLLTALAASLLIPAISLPMPQSQVADFVEPLRIESQINEITIYAQAENVNMFNFIDIITFAYIAGAVIFFGIFISAFVRIRKIITNSEKQSVNGVDVVLIDKDINPFTFMNRIVLSKSSVESKDIATVIKHELVHAEQFHTIDILLIETIKALQWFNPVVYLIGREIRENHEYLADAEAISKFDSNYNYINALLNLAMGAQMSDLANNFNSIKLIKRLKMITKQKSSRSAAAKYIMLIPAVLVLTLVFSCKDKMGEPIGNSDRYSDTYPDVIQTNSESSKYVTEENKHTVQLVDEYAIQSDIYDRHHQLVLSYSRVHSDWLKSKKAGKISVKFKVDRKGNMSDPIITNFKMADDIRWGLGKLSKEDEKDVLDAILKANRKYKPAIKDGKPIDSYSGDMILFGDENVWYNLNLGKDVYSVDSDGKMKGVEIPYKKSKDKNKTGEALITNDHLNYILKNLKYPEKARKAGIQGTVIITFSIDKDGKVSDAKVDKGIGYGCDEEALRVVKELKGFEPNKTFEGKTLLKLPIKFKLQ